MARRTALGHTYYNLLALLLTVVLAVEAAGGKGGGQNSTHPSYRASPSSSPSPSSSGSKKPKTKKIKDKNSKITRCYNEQMVEISCPATKSGKIAGYVVCGVFGVFLLFLLYKKFKGRISGKRKDLEANNHELGKEDGKSQQIVNGEKGATGEDSSSSDVSAPPPQYFEEVADDPRESVPSPVKHHSDDPGPL